MKASVTKNGLTLRVIAGSNNAIIAMDLEDAKRAGCLGFSIQKTEAGAKPRWLPNMLGFRNQPPPPPPDPGKAPVYPLLSTDIAPLQRFRWGDYTLKPGTGYRFTVCARYGAKGVLKPMDPAMTVSVDITTEDPTKDDTAVFFNRAAAASNAFNVKFPTLKSLTDATPEADAARLWLSRGLKEAVLAFLAKATDATWSLHGAVYEFQYPELLAGVAAAVARKVDVKFVYHHRKANDKDRTGTRNDDAIRLAKIGAVVVPRNANPQGAIMHNKFVVLSRKVSGKLVPQAVWTGSTNWTDGGLYGQLNVGHAIYDTNVAATYLKYFDLLASDGDASTTKHAIASLTPVSPLLPVGPGVTPIFSPQSNDAMLHLYASVAARATSLFVSAPFALSPIILNAISQSNSAALRFMLLDKIGALGEEVHVIEGDPSNSIAVATTLDSPLHNFQKQILEGKESFHHAGIHIHSKIIVADPFGSNPVIVTGSANFSNGSTEVNDSNSLVISGNAGVTDIYITEFMRMFEAYHFRAKLHAATVKDAPMALSDDDSWSNKYFVPNSQEAKDRRLFAGTH